jgi:hypothetical protein
MLATHVQSININNAYRLDRPCMFCNICIKLAFMMADRSLLRDIVCFTRKSSNCCRSGIQLRGDCVVFSRLRFIDTPHATCSTSDRCFHSVTDVAPHMESYHPFCKSS